MHTRAPPFNTVYTCTHVPPPLTSIHMHTRAPPPPHTHTHTYVGMCVHMHKEMCYENDTYR